MGNVVQLHAGGPDARFVQQIGRLATDQEIAGANPLPGTKMSRSLTEVMNDIFKDEKQLKFVSEGIRDDDRTEIYYAEFLIGFAWIQKDNSVVIRSTTNICKAFEVTGHGELPGLYKMKQFVGNMIMACRLASPTDLSKMVESKKIVELKKVVGFGESNRMIEI